MLFRAHVDLRSLELLRIGCSEEEDTAALALWGFLVEDDDAGVVLVFVTRLVAEVDLRFVAVVVFSVFLVFPRGALSSPAVFVGVRLTLVDRLLSALRGFEVLRERAVLDGFSSDFLVVVLPLLVLLALLGVVAGSLNSGPGNQGTRRDVVFM